MVKLGGKSVPTWKDREQMLCSQMHLEKQEADRVVVKILPCRRWTCEYCAPRRRNQLNAMAAAGNPRACLTLTVNSSLPGTPIDRYKALHNAWKLLVKRIIRQFALPPNMRWMLTTEEGAQYMEPRSYQITKQIKENKIKKIHYMSFAEETENGEPHLHILLRTHFIPQTWLSQQMEALIKSPIVWIEKIKAASSAIAYVTKYVTSAPAQFGTSKRYWVSRHYRVKLKVIKPIYEISRRNSRLIRMSFEGLIHQFVSKGKVTIPISDHIIAVYRPGDALKKYENTNGEHLSSTLTKAYFWLHHWRRKCTL